MSGPFDFNGSLLKRYLQTPSIKLCPSFEPSVTTGFEISCGGYGYNDSYIGGSGGLPEFASISDPAYWDTHAGNVPAKQNMIRRPSEKIAFADAAIANSSKSIIEYSFLEPPIGPYGPLDPSLHFRHGSAGAPRCNIGWADGHVSGELLEWTYPTNVYGATNSRFMLGYFGPRDNTLFQRE